MSDFLLEEPAVVLPMPLPAGEWQLDMDAPEDIVEDEPAAVAAVETASRATEPVPDDTPPPLTRIVEALFFAAREPLSVEQIAKLIRGLTTELVDTTIAQLNQSYRQQNRPYLIAPQEQGYRLILRTSYRPILEQLYGSIKEARFTQLAIETLAIVGYAQPIDEAGIENILGQPCTSPLRQLVRRGMVQLLAPAAGGDRKYVTTSRFLEFFQLSKVEDLPRADDLERL